MESAKLGVVTVHSNVIGDSVVLVVLHTVVPGFSSSGLVSLEPEVTSALPKRLQQARPPASDYVIPDQAEVTEVVQCVVAGSGPRARAF